MEKSLPAEKAVRQKQIGAPRIKVGEDKVNKKTLVAYATTAALTLGLVTMPPAFANSPASDTPSGEEVTSAGGVPISTLEKVQAIANPTPLPKPLAFQTDTQGIGTVTAVQPVAVAAAPSPSSSSSAPRPPKPADGWDSTKKTTTEFFPEAQGFMRFAKTPAAYMGPDGEKISGWKSRDPSNYPPPNWQNKGTGLCRGDSEGRTISSPYPVPDSVCWQTNTSTSADMVCYSAPYGSVQEDPYANYAWGIKWSIVAKHYLRERYTWIWVESSNAWFKTRTGEFRDFGDVSFEDYKVTWGKCETSTVPRKVTVSCVKEILSGSVYGPYGMGLPAKNFFDGREIPESVPQTKPVLRENGTLWRSVGTSPLSQAWAGGRGGKLYGIGDNSQSLQVIDTCNNWTYTGFNAPMDFLGNWRWTQEASWSLCTYIFYPEFGQRNFQGCGDPFEEISNFYYVVTCDKENPAGRFVVTSRARPDWDTNFSPEAQNCYNVKCEWINDPESTLPRRTSGQENGIAVVTNEKNPSTLLRPGRKDGVIQVPADGSTNLLRYPALDMTVLGKGAFQPRAEGLKWTVFEVKRGSSPWYIRDGKRNPDPNYRYQPFQSESRGEQGVLNVNKNPKNSLPYCIPAHDACVQRPDITSLAGPEGVPLVGSAWTRALKMNFYRPVYPLPASQEFSVRGLNHQAWIQRISTPNMTSGNPLTGVRAGSGTARNYRVTVTCATDWTDLQALSPRPAP